MRIVHHGVIASLAVAALLTAPDAGAMNNKKKNGGGKRQIEPRAPYAAFEAKGLFATGLEPVFPDGYDCPPISSPYGAKTRHDGSARNNDHHGYHNGMDISLEIGTPLLSVADGEVIHKGTAGRLVGNFVWLRYSPEATGLPVWLFAKYQHLDTPSPLAVGDRVGVGQPVGPGGRTGTVGGHYGQAGYPHLHINFHFGADESYTTRGPVVGPKDRDYLDPVGLYAGPVDGAVGNRLLRDLPVEAKQIPVAIVTTDGEIVPEGARTVWPIACERN